MNFYDYEITSPYGYREDPFTLDKSFHKGIDYAIPYGTEIKSNVTGTVTKSNYQADGFGNYVVVKDGTGKLHYYAHLQKSNVSVGDIVSVGDSIGLSGSTGRSTSAHLHYEVRESDGTTNVNPSVYISEDIEKIDIDLNPFDNIKDKIKGIVFNIFKFIIIALFIILFVIFITKALDINII